MDKANASVGVGLPKNLQGLSGLRFNVTQLSLKKILGFPLSFNPFVPGLEIKYAIEEARKVNSKIVYLG